MTSKLMITATIGAGLVGGLLWATLSGPSSAKVSAGVKEVVIERASDHHYYVDADVNGHAVHFMIDTGASETTLTPEDAKSIGIEVDPAKYEVIGDGASGMVRGQYVQLESINLDGIKQEGAKAVIVPGGSVSLIGQPFLEKIDEIVISKGEMRLRSGETA